MIKREPYKLSIARRFEVDSLFPKESDSFEAIDD